MGERRAEAGIGSVSAARNPPKPPMVERLLSIAGPIAVSRRLRLSLAMKRMSVGLGPQKF